MVEVTTLDGQRPDGPTGVSDARVASGIPGLPGTDQELFARMLAAARSNEREGWEHLYRLAAPPVLGFLRVRDTAQAEDVLGDVWLRAIRAIDGFDGTSDEFIAWMLTIARNRLNDVYRASARRPETPSDTVGRDVADEGAPDDARRDGHAAALELLAPLDERHRVVLYLRYALELEIRDIALVLDSSIAATKMTLVRARRSLRRATEGNMR